MRRSLKSVLFSAACSAACVGMLAGCSGGDASSAHPALDAHANQLRRNTKTVASDYQTAVQELYIAYFGRPADPNGLANFENALLQAGAPTNIQGLNAAYATSPVIQQLVNDFGTSSESNALYGTGNTTTFVNAIFQNVLNRAPQLSGYDFWVNAINNGVLTQGDAALSILAGALANTSTQGQLDAKLIDNRLAVAEYFTTQVSNQNDVANYVGAASAAQARTMLAAVTASTNISAYAPTVNATVAALVAPVTTTITGIVSLNAPVTSTLVTLKDAAGNTQTAQTGSDGSFSINVTGFTAPFLLQVVDGSTTLYSYASAANTTANIDPFTSIVLQAYYTAQGTSVGVAFSNPVLTGNYPSSSQLNLLVSALDLSLLPYLNAAGISQPTAFNPFTVSFTSTPSYENIINRTIPSVSLMSFYVDNGSGSTAGNLSTNMNLSVAPGNGGTLAIVTFNDSLADTVTGSASSDAITAPVGTTALQQGDLAAAQQGVLTTLNALHSIAVTKGPAFNNATVSAYVDSAFLSSGSKAGSIEASIVALLLGSQSTDTYTPNIIRVNNFIDNGATQYIDVAVQVNLVPKVGNAVLAMLDVNDNPAVGLVFKKESSGTWALYGQQTAQNAVTNVAQTRIYNANGSTPDTPIDSQQMIAQVNVSAGVLSTSASAISVSGPANSLPDGLSNCTPGPLALASQVLSQDSGSFNGLNRYDLPCGVITGGATAGTPYTFSMTLAGGSTSTQGFLLNGVTTDNGDLTMINGVARATFADNTANRAINLAGTTLTLNYTEPTTYPLQYVWLSASCQNSAEFANGGGTTVRNKTNIAPGTDTGTVVLPATCDSGVPVWLAVTVNFVGVNGEFSSVQQQLLNY